jgi:amino acid adenylation domain-containing protein
MYSYAPRALWNDERTGIPCSQSQKRFWFETRLDPHNPALNVAVRWRLEGKVVHAHLEEAWRLIVARHQTLRTAFATIDGEPRQIVEPEVPFRVQLVDLTEMPKESAVAEAERLASREAKKTFDITQAPLIRVTHIRVRPDASMILVTAHHTVCDGWSVGVLAAEMGEICAALSDERIPCLPELSATYTDYAAREQEWLAAAHGTYRDDLAERWRGFEQLEILPDKARPPVQTSNGDIVSELLDRELTNALVDIARKNRCTLFMVAYAALVALLHRYSGQTDITIGTQFAGRDEVEFERLVGTFVNTVALRTDVSGNPRFSELLERVQDTVTDAYELRYVPLEELIEIVNPKRDLSRNPLFSINFVFQRSFIKNETYGSFRLIDLPSRSAGPICDLNFFMVERPEGWRASCEFNADLYRRETVERLLQRWIIMLRAIARDPSSPVSALPLMSDEERQAVLALGCGEITAYERNANVHELFAQRVAETPDAVAVVDHTGKVTYAELDRRANQLGRYLRTRGIGPNTTVGVALERAAIVPLALLAILKAGAAYVPLDPSYPGERLAFIVRDASVALILTEPGVSERIPNDVPIVDLTGAASEIAAHASTPLGQPGRPDAPAYVMYTSGSTGQPKGVEVPHRAIVRLVRATNYIDIGAGDTVLQYAPLAFDASTFEIWAPLLNGGRLAIAPPGQLSIVELQRTLARFEVTTLWLTAAVFRETVEADLAALRGLRYLLAGGDVVSAFHAKRFIDAYPNCRLINGYGPTENTTFSCAYPVPSSDAIAQSVPIGRAIANSSAYILDSQLQPLPLGAVGELCVGGDGLALGYLNLPDLTAERFVTNPFLPESQLYRTGDSARLRDDGVIEFLGRLDEQVKIRGFRIEPREIEAALSGYSGICDAAVVIGTETSGDKTIWAYVVPRGAAPEAFDVEALRVWLKERLPAFMLPSAIIALTALPLSSNGKVDRRALPPPERPSSSAEYHGATEERLGNVLAEFLGTTHVDRDVDIFALGFHSLLAVRFVTRVKQMFAFEMPLRVLFENPTVAAIAAYIDDALSSAQRQAATPIVTLNAGGSQTPLILFHSDLFADGLYVRRLAAALGPDQPIYSVAPHGEAGLPLLPTIESMALDYATLIRSVQPTGPYRLAGYCAGGLVAYELARLLRSQGEVVDRLLLMNSSPMPPRRIGLFDALIRRCGLDKRIAPPLRDRLCYNLARLHAAVLMGPRVTLSFVGKTLRALLGGHSGAPARGFEPQSFEKRRGSRETENSFAHLVAAFTYHPKPHDGSATLVWGAEQQTTFDDPTKGWGSVLQHIDIELIGGGHVGAVHERIDELSQLLKTILGDDVQ